MAKKIRFPLEMENDIEVRNLEELKENFSLARVIGYINDGKLVAWLQDRYENELAEEVEKIDIEAEATAKKICELFDVEYDESAEEEVEKAEERKRKLELLKKFPDCMEYAKYIDLVAFDQDDLYNLLDENANVIYLCGSRFSIPIAKSNIKYVGILDKVVVVINSKEAVEFDAKGISFKNCIFDENYTKLLNKKEAEKKVEKEDKINTDDSKFNLDWTDAFNEFYRYDDSDVNDHKHKTNEFAEAEKKIQREGVSSQHVVSDIAGSIVSLLNVFTHEN